MKPRIVLDSSVVTKWYVREVNSQEAGELKTWLQEGAVLVAVPDLFFVEIANVLWKKWMHMKDIGKIEAQEIFREVMNLPFQTLPDRELLKETFILSSKYAISIYDSLYLAAASELEALFITADDALVNKLKHTPLFTSIIPLSQWQARV